MTAEEFMTQEQYYAVTSGDEFEIQKIMKDFAQYHVDLALKQASTIATFKVGSVTASATGLNISILNAYPKDNIK